MTQPKIGFDGKPKPWFEEGERVTFDFGTGPKGRGKIRGLASEHVIDMWIVEVTEATGIDKGLYPWSCLVIQHTMLARE